MVEKIRDYFGMPKEEYEWDRQDMKIIIGFAVGCLVITFMAAYQALIYKRLMDMQSMRGEILVTITFLCFSIYGFGALINLSSKGKFNKTNYTDAGSAESSKVYVSYRNSNNSSFVCEDKDEKTLR